ncbi:Tsc11p [Lachancea thermotolerans]
MTSQRSSPHLTRSRSSADEILTRSRHNTVLSTSFVSTRRADEQPASPLSAHKPRRTRSGTAKSINNLKHDIHHVQQDLVRLRKSKEDTEKLKESATNDIYPGNYSQEHLQRHSMVLQSNNQLRKLDQQIKKSGDLLSSLRKKLDSTTEEVRPTASTNPSFISKELRRTSDYTTADDSTTAEELSARSLSEDDVSSASLDEASNGESPGNKQVSSSDAAASEKHATWLVSDYLQSLQDKNASTDYLLETANDLTLLLKQNPTIKFDLYLPAFSSTIQQLLLSDADVTVAAAYRICRHLITGQEFIQELLKLHLEPFLIISLAKPNSCYVERLHALKLIRSFLGHDAGITLGLVQAIISCIEKPDDRLREVALETLLELCYTKPMFVRRCGGIQFLGSFIGECSSPQQAAYVLDAMLDLMTFRETRSCFIDSFDVRVVLTSLSDSQIKANFNAERLKSGINLISRCLTNYNGIILFSQDDFRPLRELLAFFQAPQLASYLVDLFLDVLRIRSISPTDKKTANHNFKISPSHFHFETMPINQYVGLLAGVLYKVGFIDCLLGVLIQLAPGKKDHGVAAKTRYLITEYCNIAMNLAGLKPSASAGLLSFNYSDFEKVFSEVFQYEKVTNKLNKSRNTIGMSDIGSLRDIMDFSEQLKHKALINDVDEARFKRMVYDTRVLQTKDFSLWNWSILSDLLEGPLLNGKRLDDLARTTKFFRRLMVFYRPMRFRFSKIRQGSRLAPKCVHVGRQLFRTLTSNREGIKILSDDTKLIPQIASLLFKAMEGHTAGNVFSRESLSKTVCAGYFKIIGTFTESLRGVRILEKWNVFTVIYKMFQHTSKFTDSFLLLILPELDLEHSLHCRNILNKALVHPMEEVRVEATRLLGNKIQDIPQKASTSGREKVLEKFLVELLVRQLYDLSPKVIAAADKILHDYCATQDWPPRVDIPRHHLLDQLMFIRSPILLEFLKTPAGFKQLNDIGFVETEREKWISHKNKEYVSRVEAFIQAEASKFSNDTSYSTPSRKKLPMHFCHSLASTEEGVNLISQKGDFVQIINIIKRYRHNNFPDLTVDEDIELKAALWCCGHIGSTEPGINLLDNYSIVNDIVSISLRTSSMSIKFTSFFVLGLVAKTNEGCEILDELGWDCSLNVQKVPLGLTFPRDVLRFLRFPESNLSDDRFADQGTQINDGDAPLEYEVPTLDLDMLLNNKAKAENTMGDAQEELQAEIERQTRNLEMFRLQACQISSDEALDRVMRAASKLNNHILCNAAVKEITEVISTYGAARFETPKVFFWVLGLLEQYRFKPQARKFLCDLLLRKKTLEVMIRKDKKKRKS